MKLYFCKSCKQEISDESKSGLCRSCVAKERCKDPTKNANYKDGRSLVINKCEICGKQIGWKNKRCVSCSKIKYWFSVICIDCGKILKNRKALRCLSCRGKHRFLLEGNIAQRPDAKRKMSQTRKGRPLTAEWKANLSKAITKVRLDNPFYRTELRGKDHPCFGHPMRPVWGCYNGVNMRSSWEIKFASWCDKHNIIWLYEPKTFDLGNTTYTPDFYLPEYHLYIEIKGYLTSFANKKIELFKFLNPYISYKLLAKQELQEEGILNI